MPGINEILDSIATGNWTSGMSLGSINSIGKLIGIVIVLAIVLDVFLRYHRRKGHFTHPDAKPEERIHDVVHLINSELRHLYSSDLVDKIIAKKGGLKQGSISGPGLNPSEVVFRKGGFFSAKVWEFKLAEPEEVKKGNFGRIILNMHFLTVRTNQHRYALNIAAQLFFFQVSALSGKNPRSFQGDNKRIKKGGDFVLALAGQLKDAASLNEHVIVNLVKHDRKVDEEIADTLAITEEKGKELEAELQKKVRSLHDVSRFEWHVAVKWQAKLLVWIEKEIGQLKELYSLMEEKKKTVAKFVEDTKPGPDREDKFLQFEEQWDKDMTYIADIIRSLESIKNNKDYWYIQPGESHHWWAVRKSDLSRVTNELSKESEKKSVDINKVHAIFSAFTAERGRILKLMRTAEAEI